MIRFFYDKLDDVDLPFEHFSIEGNNKRGYVLLGWNHPPPDEVSKDLMLQQWYEALGEALDYCNREFFIMRDDWHAPTTEPPVSGNFKRVDRRRQQGQARPLNPKSDAPKDMDS